MYKTCKVNWHGALRKIQVEIGKDVTTFFSIRNRNIVLHINNKKYYTKLPDCFFSGCSHLRTAYDTPDKRSKNRLHEWITNNDIKEVKLEVIKQFQEYKLTKVK